jgi:hypothetical protein
VEKTGRQIKEQFKQDMRMVAKQDRLESVAITEAVENSPEIQPSPSTTESTNHTLVQWSSSEQDEEEEEEQKQKG